jgi:hypothetical protein
MNNDNVPDGIEEALDHGYGISVAFNRNGTLLAVGCGTGHLVVYVFSIFLFLLHHLLYLSSMV